MNLLAEKWTVTIGDKEQRSMSRIHKKGDPDFIVADVFCDWFNEEQRKEDIARAHLIGAAPDMYKALRAITNDCKEVLAGRRELSMELIHDIANGLARSAMAKANGET